MSLAAIYFDGKSSTRHPVAARLENRDLVLDGFPVSCRYAIDQLEMCECLDGGAVTIRMADGASCEIEQGPAFEALVSAAGRRTPLLVRLQRHAAGALFALLLLGGLVFAGYRWGLPWVAARLAPQLPAQTVRHLGTHVLKTLDRDLLKPSLLAADRQAGLRARVKELAVATVLPAHQLHFRSAPGLGANAFALPGGIVVVLDRMAELADDEQMLAVIAHELGHVAQHHALRRLIQEAVVATAVAAYLGDLSTAAASATAFALDAGYSREFELEADRFAVERLAASGHDPRLLIRLLEKIDRPGRGGSLFSSHPDVAERADAIRRFVATKPPPIAKP